RQDDIDSQTKGEGIASRALRMTFTLSKEGSVAQFDLVIRGGTLVDGEADMGIANGRIAQVGGDMQAPVEIDAVGKLVLPGGVDAHVHLSNAPREAQEPRWVDD